MKCPKCGYLGFESGDRCRNCGYDFLLAPPAGIEPDLTLRSAEEHSPLSNLDLAESGAQRPTASMPNARERDGAGLASDSEPSHASDLPLFGSHVLDGEPLITKPSPPRAPLAVRRTTPVPRRSGVKPARAQTADLSLNLEPGPVTPPSLPPRDEGAQPAVTPGEVLESASLAARVVAAAIDLLVLAAVDFAVVYFTIQVCGLRLLDVLTLPKIPLAAFLLVQNGGYLVAFTASGQTLGKMAAGIRVVSTDSDTVGIGAAFRRTAMWLILAAPAGIGLLSVLLGSDHRGIHDRLARTRVVRSVS
jgi:uncharacterized RDD family membrane protein YckC